MKHLRYISESYSVVPIEQIVPGFYNEIGEIKDLLSDIKDDGSEVKIKIFGVFKGSPKSRNFLNNVSNEEFPFGTTNQTISTRYSGVSYEVQIFPFGKGHKESEIVFFQIRDFLTRINSSHMINIEHQTLDFFDSGNIEGYEINVDFSVKKISDYIFMHDPTAVMSDIRFNFFRILFRFID